MDTELVVESDFVVEHELGLHARPAALFVQTAQKYQSEITVTRDSTEASAKSILGILSLGVAQGMRICVRAEGPDAAEAVTALQQLVERNFDETEE